MPLEPGTVVGDYRVLEKLGVGGMGQVYKVRNLLSKRTEAMKILPPEVTPQDRQLKRFLREIQVHASLVHPNIASFYTAMRWENRLVMLMELVEGETIEARVAKRSLEIRAAIDVAIQILDALAYAHSCGVLHRDIKPSNIMLARTGAAKLLDFGLAAVLGEVRLTPTGMVLGSLHYMSPEQVRGEPATQASDIYSLGLTIYEMLTGRQGIEGGNPYAVMTAHLQNMPLPPAMVNPLVPDWLSEIVLKGIAKASGDRFLSVLEFKRALESCQAVASPPPKPVSVQGPNRRHKSDPPASIADLVSATDRSTQPMSPVQPLGDLRSAVQRVVPPTAGSEPIVPPPRAKPLHRPQHRRRWHVTAAAVALLAGSTLLWKHQSHTSPQTAFTSIERAPSSPERVSTPPIEGQPKDLLPGQEATNHFPPNTSPPTKARRRKIKTAEQQEDEDWERGRSNNAKLRRFLVAYPEGKHSVEAREALARFDWDALETKDDLLSLREFVRQHPLTDVGREALISAESMGVLKLIAQFGVAVSGRDFSQIQQLWPSAAPEVLNRVSDRLKQDPLLNVHFVCPQKDVYEYLMLPVRLDLEVANVGVRCAEQLSHGEEEVQQTTALAAYLNVRRRDGNWTIASVTTSGSSGSDPFSKTEPAPSYSSDSHHYSLTSGFGASSLIGSSLLHPLQVTQTGSRNDLASKMSADRIKQQNAEWARQRAAEAEYNRKVQQTLGCKSCPRPSRPSKW
jgi:serine/threonine protein kinase